MALRTLLLALANLLIPVSILIFATGFFPYKPFMPGLATYEDSDKGDVLGKASREPPKAPFDKLVFMVVDALRSDFVFGEESGMSFVQRSVELYLGNLRLEADTHPVSYEMAPPCPSPHTQPPPPSPCRA
jgi:hypothetical protein